MKIIGVIIATSVIGFLAFQNCQQAPNPNDIATSSSDGKNDASKVVDLKSEKISEVDLNFNENETVMRSSGSYQIVVNKTLKIFLPTGQMVLMSDLSNTEQNYCLTANLINELVNVLKVAQVCSPEPSSTTQMCAMVYTFPYAKVITEKASYSLGGGKDSCEAAHPVDLCGDQATMLRGIVTSIKSNYKQMACQ